jgi:hypothetical protein
MPEPTITAKLKNGPLNGKRIETAVIEGRPPMTIDVVADDGERTYRYGLTDLEQEGDDADYSFLYGV